jgi:hypothetical protein
MHQCIQEAALGSKSACKGFAGALNMLQCGLPAIVLPQFSGWLWDASMTTRRATPACRTKEEVARHGVGAGCCPAYPSPCVSWPAGLPTQYSHHTDGLEWRGVCAVGGGRSHPDGAGWC